MNRWSAVTRGGLPWVKGVTSRLVVGGVATER